MTEKEFELIKKNINLAGDLKKFLEKHDLHHDTRIYLNNFVMKNCSEFEVEIKASDYFEYANDETVSMSFEGPLYHLLNYGGNVKLLEKFDKIFEKHNCYYELGYAWSLSVYYNEEEK